MIVAYKDHVSEIVNISDEERNRYMADVARVAKALHAAFHPKKVNYGADGELYDELVKIYTHRLKRMFTHG